MDPLSEVARLAIDLRYSNREPMVIEIEESLHDTLLGGMIDVLYRRDIVFCGDSLSLCEKARCDTGDQRKK